MLTTLISVVVAAFLAAPAEELQASAASRAELVTRAESADVAAQLELGLTLLSDGGRRERETGIGWLRKAADAGHPLSQRLMGDILSTGKLVPKDDVAALGWYRRAADAGDPDAQAELGLRYARGVGVPIDTGLAVEWELKAAAAGSVEAFIYLASRYARGDGVPHDFRQAIELYDRAAHQGSALGMCLTGYMIQQGEGQVPNAQEAYRWLFAAFTVKTAPRAVRPINSHQLGDRERACRQLLENTRQQLSPQARRVAEDEARTWLASLRFVVVP